MLRKNPNELFGQPYKMHILGLGIYVLSKALFSSANFWRVRVDYFVLLWQNPKAEPPSFWGVHGYFLFLKSYSKKIYINK